MKSGYKIGVPLRGDGRRTTNLLMKIRVALGIGPRGRKFDTDENIRDELRTARYEDWKNGEGA